MTLKKSLQWLLKYFFVKLQHFVGQRRNIYIYIIYTHCVYHVVISMKKIESIKLFHEFLYYTRTDFMPFATLKIRPNYFNVL